MSNSNDFGGGGCNVGSLVSFPDTLANTLTVSGQTFIKTGVTALASAYPQVQAQMQALNLGAPTIRTRPEVFGSVAWSPTLSLFVATPLLSTGNIYSSPDGITWTSRFTNIAFVAQLVYWTGTKFIAFPFGSLTTSMQSSNGTTWTTLTLPALTSGGNITSVAQVGTLIVVNASSSSSTGATWTSSDSGTTWATGSVPSNCSGIPILASATNFFFSSTTGNTGYVSATGTSFVTNTWNSGAPLANIRSDGTYYYGDNPGTVIANSPIGTLRTQDGVTWTLVGQKQSQALGLFITWSSIAGLWISASGITSTDALTGRKFATHPSGTTLGGVYSQIVGNGSGHFAIGAGIIVFACAGCTATQAVTYAAPAVYIDNTINSSNTAGTTNYMRVA